MDHQQWLEQHDRMMADFDLRQTRLQASQEKTEKTLRWAIRLGVQDARRQRKRNAEFEGRTTHLDETMRQLAAALKAFLERGGNGKH